MLELVQVHTKKVFLDKCCLFRSRNSKKTSLNKFYITVWWSRLLLLGCFAYIWNGLDGLRQFRVETRWPFTFKFTHLIISYFQGVLNVEWRFIYHLACEDIDDVCWCQIHLCNLKEFPLFYTLLWSLLLDKFSVHLYAERQLTGSAFVPSICQGRVLFGSARMKTIMINTALIRQWIHHLDVLLWFSKKFKALVIYEGKCPQLNQKAKWNCNCKEPRSKLFYLSNRTI